MTKSEVQRLLGQPREVSVYFWYYYAGNDAKISFATSNTNEVEGWSKPQDARRSRNETASPAWHELRIGSSKKDVLRILGHPDEASLYFWYYGPDSDAKVSFSTSDTDLVEGWSKPKALKRTKNEAASLRWNDLSSGLTKGRVLQLLGHPDDADLYFWRYGSNNEWRVSFSTSNTEIVEGWKRP